MTIPVASKRILLIEDEPTLRAIMYRYLTEAGYAVTQAPFGEEGVRQILENPCDTFDVVIADYSLGGGLSGGEAVNAMRQKCPDTSVLFISGHDLPPDLMRGEACLQKPAMPADVIAEVERLIRAKCSTIPPGP